MCETVSTILLIIGLIIVAIPAISLYREVQRFKEEDRAFEAQKRGEKDV